MITRREVPIFCRSWLAVAGPCFERNSATAVRICSAASRSKTISLFNSTIFPCSIKNRSACCRCPSSEKSLRLGGSNGFAESASQIFICNRLKFGGKTGRCEIRAMADPLRTKLSAHRSAIIASKTIGRLIAQRRAKLVQIETGPLGISFVRGVDQTDRLVAQLLPEFGVRRDLSMPNNFVAAL